MANSRLLSNMLLWKQCVYIPKVSDLCVQQNIKATVSLREKCNNLLLLIVNTLYSKQSCTQMTENKENINIINLNMLKFLNGIIHHPFLEQSIFILGLSRWKLHGQPTVQSLVRLHGCAGRSGSKRLQKTNHFLFQQDKRPSRKVNYVNCWCITKMITKL